MASNLQTLISGLPSGGVHRQTGVMVSAGSGLAVNVWGNVIPARYADPLYLAAGDPVLVDITSRGFGQSEAVVICKLTAQPRPATGTITAVPIGDTVQVEAEDGLTYTAEFIGTYAVGNYVYLNWAAGTPTVVGKKGETKPPPKPKPDPVQVEEPTPPPPPPARKTTGRTEAVATWSGTWVSQYNVWDNWAGGNQNLFQGSSYGPPLTGAWFYGTKLRGLNDGRRITRIRFKLGSRRSVGNYNATLNVHLYTHRSSSRPSGNVSLDDGPKHIALGPRRSADWYDLPLSWAPRLLAGGGIAMHGDPYLSINGRRVQPESGLLLLDWEK